jgi:hypothetical protein
VTLTSTATPNGSVFSDHLSAHGEEPCPTDIPPVVAPTQSCHFTVTGDALYSVLFSSEESAEEESSGGGSTPSGGSGSEAGSSSGSPPAATPPSSPVVPSPTATTKPKPKPLKCRKGLKKGKVHGKAKCIKVKKKRHRR